MNITSKANLKKVYPSRSKWVHKGNYGKLLVIAGSEQYTGSPIFNCMSALRAGVDLVHLYSCRRAADIAASFTPDIITIPFEGKELNTFQVERALELLPEYDALVIGGGLGSKEETHQAIREILHACRIPAVIDADAIRALQNYPQALRNKNFVLTPHANELLSLGGKEVGSDLKKRISETKRIASSLKSVILLKGAIDVLSDGKEVFLNKTGSSYMTKGGGGDCLAGICGALLARKMSCMEAACASAFINGRAGEIASREKKEGFIASDLFFAIPKAIN